MELLIFNEHHNYPNGAYIPEDVIPQLPNPICFKGKEDAFCVNINSNRRLHSSYYVGADWLNHEKAVYIEPKLNIDAYQTNFLGMLQSVLENSHLSRFSSDLFEIKYQQPFIELPRERDILTPLLVMHFLQLTSIIVRKGIKKSYYRVKYNLKGKVKGKVLVSDTLKQDVFKNRPLNNYCTYDEFGYNNVENRLLKKTLLFANRYLKETGLTQSNQSVPQNLTYLINSFQKVSSKISLKEVKYSKPNPFYSEYDEAIRIAKIILWRYGYSINNITNQTHTKVPPFWIDMSKLFELYVLRLLRNRFGEAVDYQFKTHYRILDYLLNSSENQMVVDAKYKRYDTYPVKIEDIRQVAAYARMTDVYKQLNIAENQTIPCLIIYPDNQNGVIDFHESDLSDLISKIQGYNGIYKVGVKLPQKIG